MPKVNTNSNINYFQTIGRVIQHDLWINQAVTQDSSPTFGNLAISGDTQIAGNLYVYGNTSIFNTNITEFEDNILLINRTESGPGITLGLAGFEVSRGPSLENFRAVFRESDDTFRIGLVNSTQAVATREDSPLNNGIAVWNSTENRFDSKNSIDLSINLKSTENSINSSTGSLRVTGGIGVSKDIYVSGKTNYSGYSSIDWNSSASELQIASGSRIGLRPGTDVFIPLGTQLTFGTGGNSIVSTGTENLVFNANGKISIPSDIPLVFSKTDSTKKITGDSSGNLSLTSGLDIQITPSRNVVIPTLIPLTFGGSSQRIFGNNFGDVVISSNNNILLNPVGGLDVVIPQESGVRFGPVARVWSSPSNSLLMSATGITVSSGSFRLENGTSLFIGQTELRHHTYTSGSTSTVLQVLGTVEIPNMIITTVSTGSLGVNGDAYIRGNTVIDGNLNVNGTTTTINTDIQLIKDNLIVVNSGPAGLADSGLLMKRFSDGVSTTVGNIYAGLVYQESSDQIVLGYTTTDPGTGPVTFSEYIPLQSDRITIMNTSDVTSSSVGSLIVGGGAFIKKSIRTDQDIFLSETGSIYLGETSIKSSGSGTDVLVSGVHTFISSTVDANVGGNSRGSLIVAGGEYISKNLVVGGKILSTNSSSGHQIGNLIFNNSSILATNGSSVSFPNGFGIEDYYFNQLTNGQLSISGNGTGTSGVIFSTDRLDILGETTITDTLELFESSFLLNSGSRTFSIVPTGSNLELTSDHASNQFSIKNLNVSLENSSGTSVVSYDNLTQSFTIGPNVYTEITDQTDLVGKLMLKLDNTGHIQSNWFLLEGIENFTQFSMVIDDTFFFTKEQNQGHLHNYFEGNVIPIKVYQITGDISYYVKVDAGKSRSLSIFNKSGSVSKINLTVTSLPGPESGTIIYDTESTSPNKDIFVGNIYSYGDNANFSDLKPIFGYQNSDTTGSQKVGVAFERSKELVVDSQSPAYSFVLPSQTGVVNSNQIKFGTSGPIDDLTGAILKTADLAIYRIVEYDPNIKVATIEGSFTVAPQLNDTVNIYDQAFIDFVYNETAETTELRYSPSSSADPYGSLKVGDITTTRDILIGGELQVNSTKSATSITSAACIVSGGVGISKELYVGESIHVTSSSSNRSTRLSNNLLNYTETLGISNGTDSGLYFNSLGNIGVRTTSVNTAKDLTFRSSGSIGIENEDGYLDLLGRMKLYGNSNSKVEVSAGSLVTSSGCQVSILNTTVSSSATTGALVVGGGLTVSGNSNAISSSVGGALTVAGGGSVAKDFYIGGNLVINGSIELAGAVITPTVLIHNGSLVNCNLATVVYSKLVKLSLNYTLQICLEINPNVAYQNTEVQFTLPGRIDPFTKRTDTFTTSSGWSDNDAVVPLFNVVSCGVSGTQRVLVKFQSVSTNTHYLQIMCMYNEF